MVIYKEAGIAHFNTQGGQSAKTLPQDIATSFDRHDAIQQSFDLSWFWLSVSIFNM